MKTRKKPFTYFIGHVFSKTDSVQCLGANCPLCGIWQETQEKDTSPRKPKTPNMLDKHVAGFGKQSFTRRFN